MPRISPAFAAALLAPLALGACTGPFTGPVEVTRFVSPDRSVLGRGTISAFNGSCGSPWSRLAAS